MRYDDHILKIYQNSFRNNWDLPALTDYGSQEVMTYADFARRIARLHLFYRQIGLKPGDHVALLGKNSASWVVMFIGTITYGATIVPILADFNPHDAQHIVNHSDARVLFVNSSIWETLDFEEMPELKAAVSLETRQVLAERETEGHQMPSRIIRNLTRKFKATYPKGFRREDVVYPEIDAENTAILNYTSGTTGFSKGVMLTYDNIAGNVNYGIVSRLHYEGSRALSFLPLNSEVEQFLYRIKFPFTVGYGMTECGPLISHTPWRSFVPSSCGRTLPCMESKIMGSKNPETEPGEICVRGQDRMKGYYKAPDITAATIDEEGWLHTGDMGTRAADGTLFIKGRYKTMILSASGQNIYPEEIEAKLNNMPYVAESLVVERGKGLTAIVYPDYERMDADKVDMQALPELMEANRNELNGLVAPYERVDRIQLIPHEFEKTPKKSIKRYLYS